MKMADYLYPECNISVLEKYEIFSIRSEINEFPNHFGDKTLCTMGCLEILNSDHVTIYPRLKNKGSSNLDFKNIFKEIMKP